MAATFLGLGRDSLRPAIEPSGKERTIVRNGPAGHITAKFLPSTPQPMSPESFREHLQALCRGYEAVQLQNADLARENLELQRRLSGKEGDSCGNQEVLRTTAQAVPLDFTASAEVSENQGDLVTQYHPEPVWTTSPHPHAVPESEVRPNSAMIPVMSKPEDASGNNSARTSVTTSTDEDIQKLKNVYRQQFLRLAFGCLRKRGMSQVVQIIPIDLICEMLQKEGSERPEKEVGIALKHLNLIANTSPTTAIEEEDDGAQTFLTLDGFLGLMAMSDTDTAMNPTLGVLKKTFHKDAQCYDAQKFVDERNHSHFPDDSAINPMILIMLDILPAVMILANALVIGMSQDIDPNGVVWEYVNLVFTAFFTGEFALKCYLFGTRTVLFGPDKWWNLFDLFCVCIAFVDVGIFYVMKAIAGPDGDVADLGYLMLLKILRLARLARLIRLMRFKMFNELKMMVEGVISGVRVLFWAIILLFVLIFTLAICVRTLFMDRYPEFGSLMGAMFTLFRCFTDGCTGYDGTPLQERVRIDYCDTGFVFLVIYILVFLFVTVGIFNLIMAIFIDNVVSANVKKKQHLLGQHAPRMKSKMSDVITSLMQQGENAVKVVEDIGISREVFNLWLMDKEMLEMLEETEIETSTKSELFDVLDVDMGGELSYSELVEGLMSLRGPISKVDICAVKMKVKYLTVLIQQIHAHLGLESGLA